MLQNIDTKKLKLLAQASKGIAQTCCEQERSGLRYSNENLSLLWRCAQDWDAMLYLRKEHARNLRYKNGDQWCDKVPDPENPGKMIREDALISRSTSETSTGSFFHRRHRLSYMPEAKTINRWAKCLRMRCSRVTS